jgi:dTDP-4-dehydrorhamnose reductase
MSQTEHGRLIHGVDVENLDSLVRLFTNHRPSVVINCVGIIKQHSDAEDPHTAISINSMLPHRLHQLCKLIKARLIHISTDCVFSGSKGMYAEKDFPDANDVYGRTKLLGEVSGEHAITIRTSLIGHEINSNKSLINWFLSQENNVQGYRNAIFSGLPTVEIARIIDRHVIPNPGLEGVIHVSAEPIDKYSLLCLVKRIYGKKIDIKKNSDLIIDRSLDSTLFRGLTGYRPPDWETLVTGMREFS